MPEYEISDEDKQETKERIDEEFEKLADNSS
jgi:hypothetical protein